MDDCDLEQLAKEAAKRKRWEFMLTAAPMAIAGGTGSPLNSIATFYLGILSQSEIPTPLRKNGVALRPNST